MYLLICVLFDKKTVVPQLIFFSICNRIALYIYGHFLYNRIGDVMVSMVASSVVDPGYEPGWVKPKSIKLVFSTKHATLRRKSKDWLARNQDNMPKWGLIR